MKQIQQGDVLLKRVTDVGNRAIISKDRCVLAEGEHTGHAHIIEAEGAELFSSGGKRFLSLPIPGTLKHDEHNPIEVEPGLYEIGIVKEYDYFSKMVREVKD